VGVEIAQTYKRVDSARAAEVLRTSPRFRFEDGGKRVYLAHLAEAEISVAAYARGGAPTEAKAIAFGPEPTLDQRKALELLTSGAPLVVVTGYPGTGKTWTIAEYVKYLGFHGVSYELCAPTGKAARRMTEALAERGVVGVEARTIHRLLEWTPKGFQRHQGNPVPADVVVVDESSMLDLQLAANLLGAVRHSQVVFVGDVNQLPPVGPGAVLRDLIRSERVPTAMLRELKRTTADTWVFRNAPMILEEGRCELDHDGDDFMFYELEAGAAGMLAPTIVEIVRGLIDKGHKLSDFQVISPMKERIGGTFPLNEALQRDLNEHVGIGPCVERRIGERKQLLARGDRVIQTRNNYDLWVMNGEIGTVESVSDKGTSCAVRFPDGVRVYDGATLDDLQLAYALTVHRFQGSETDIAIVVAHSAHSNMLTRQLFYTAVTRAKKRVIVVGDEAGVQMALRTKRDEYRRTRLVERIREGSVQS
jgi:exodeoxyribonuclease V alpha subunit